MGISQEDFKAFVHANSFGMTESMQQWEYHTRGCNDEDPDSKKTMPLIDDAQNIKPHNAWSRTVQVMQAPVFALAVPLSAVVFIVKSPALLFDKLASEDVKARLSERWEAMKATFFDGKNKASSWVNNWPVLIIKKGDSGALLVARTALGALPRLFAGISDALIIIPFLNLRQGFWHMIGKPLDAVKPLLTLPNLEALPEKVIKSKRTPNTLTPDFIKDEAYKQAKATLKDCLDALRAQPIEDGQTLPTLPLAEDLGIESIHVYLSMLLIDEDFSSHGLDKGESALAEKLSDRAMKHIQSNQDNLSHWLSLFWLCEHHHPLKTSDTETTEAFIHIDEEVTAEEKVDLLLHLSNAARNRFIGNTLDKALIKTLGKEVVERNKNIERHHRDKKFPPLKIAPIYRSNYGTILKQTKQMLEKQMNRINIFAKIPFFTKELFSLIQGIKSRLGSGGFFRLHKSRRPNSGKNAWYLWPQNAHAEKWSDFMNKVISIAEKSTCDTEICIERIDKKPKGQNQTVTALKVTDPKEAFGKAFFNALPAYEQKEQEGNKIITFPS